MRIKIPLTKSKSSSIEDLSEFQKWILSEEGIDDPSKLSSQLKNAFQEDSWKNLAPALYSKWSTYHWGI